MTNKTFDPVNQVIVKIRDQNGISRLGLHTNKMWLEDPRHLLFALSRYKFVAKLLSGRKNVLEIGCGDSFSSRIVVQEVENLLAIDVDPLFIRDAEERADKNWPFKLKVHNILQGPIEGVFDAAFSLDVLEHIDPEYEGRFIANIMQSLTDDGVLIIGMPSLESQVYSKPASITGHINCKSGPDLKALMGMYFSNVFLFSMNDEVVHTGHHKMAHYIIVLCCGQRDL